MWSACRLIERAQQQVLHQLLGQFRVVTQHFHDGIHSLRLCLRLELFPFFF